MFRIEWRHETILHANNHFVERDQEIESWSKYKQKNFFNLSVITMTDLMRLKYKYKR